MFLSQAKCEATDTKMMFFILLQIKVIFTGKVLRIASVWKWDFLELENRLFIRLLYFFKYNSLRLKKTKNLNTTYNVSKSVQCVNLKT